MERKTTTIIQFFLVITVYFKFFIISQELEEDETESYTVPFDPNQPEKSGTVTGSQVKQSIRVRWVLHGKASLLDKSKAIYNTYNFKIMINHL